MMLLAMEVITPTMETTVLGLLVLLLTVGQSLWQMKKAEWDKAQAKKDLELATNDVKIAAESAANSAVANSNKLDTVYEALNGNGLMGAVKQLSTGIKTNNDSLLAHIKDDSDWMRKIDGRLGGIETMLRGDQK